MASDIAKIISEYRERCAQRLQGAAPGSEEDLAYTRILRAFDQNQTGEPFERSAKIALALAFEANSIQALRLAPRETHEQAARVRRIVSQWAEDFKRDTGHSDLQFNFVRR